MNKSNQDVRVYKNMKFRSSLQYKNVSKRFASLVVFLFAAYLPATALATAAVSITLGVTSSMSHVYAAPDDKKPATPVPSIPTVTNVESDCPKGNCIIEKYINPAIALLSALVGIAVTISIIYGGIQYASSGGNPQKAAEARQRITTSVFVLLGFFVFLAFITWATPGGIDPLDTTKL
jgi:hypothetical protein